MLSQHEESCRDGNSPKVKTRYLATTALALAAVTLIGAAETEAADQRAVRPEAFANAAD